MHKKGFMLIEIIIAASLIAVAVLAILGVAQKSINVSRQSMHTAQAEFLLEEGAEAVRVFRDNAWANISALSTGPNYYPTFSGGTWTLSSTPNSVGIFTRKVVISSVNRNNATSDIAPSGTDDPGTKFVTVTVSWPEGGSSVTKTVSFYITNIFSSP